MFARPPALLQGVGTGPSLRSWFPPAKDPAGRARQAQWTGHVTSSCQKAGRFDEEGGGQISWFNCDKMVVVCSLHQQPLWIFATVFCCCLSLKMYVHKCYTYIQTLLLLVVLNLKIIDALSLYNKRQQLDLQETKTAFHLHLEKKSFNCLY